jgi:hypothetical protein
MLSSLRKRFLMNTVKKKVLMSSMKKFLKEAPVEDDVQMELEENQIYQRPLTPKRQGKRNVRRTHPVGSGNIRIVREHEAVKEKRAAQKEVRGKISQRTESLQSRRSWKRLRKERNIMMKRFP